MSGDLSGEPGSGSGLLGRTMRRLLQPWRNPAALWWDLVHVVTGWLLAGASFVGTLVLAILSVVLLIVLPLAIPVAWVLFMVVRVIGKVQRSRYAALRGVQLDDPVPPLEGRTWWQRFKERLRSRPRWYEVVYSLPWSLVTIAGYAALQAVWAMSAALIPLPLYVGQLPGDTAKFGLFEVGAGAGAILMSLVGVIGLVVAAPWLTRLMVQLDEWVARRLLGRRPGADALEARVAQLEATRSAMVDSAEAERRRIERDLHDGAQQRLVAMAVNLGAAREKLDQDPEAGRQLVAEAHEDAKSALEELRDLVRGIHPVILEDRGLDAALSAIVARVPVPVDLTVEVAQRPPPSVENAAYFVVAEALTNVARHAEASSVEVNLVRAGDRLVVEVRDDGVGGADPGRGTGLAGLRGRVEALDGRLDLISPAGGPTTLLVELPCAS